MKFSEHLYELARPFYDYKPETPNVPILYYVDINHKDYHQVINYLDKHKINYVPVLIKPKMMTEEFVHLLLSWTKNGFDDIVRKTFFKYLFPKDDYNELKTSKMVQYLINNYVDLLKPFIWVDSEGDMITTPSEKEFKKYTREGTK